MRNLCTLSAILVSRVRSAAIPRGTMIVRGIRPETGRLLLMIMESRDMIME